MLILLFSLLQAAIISGCVLPLQDGYVPSNIRHARDITTNCGPDDIPPPNRVNTTERLAVLREEMRRRGLQAYIVPLDDESRLRWISGFSGSAGKAVITMDEARLWTDGRYFLQAADQLDCNWYLMRESQEGVEDFDKWIGQNLQDYADQNGQAVIGACADQLGAGTWLDWQESFKSYSEDMILEPVENLIDLLWTEQNGRPPQILRDIKVHGLQWSGESWQSKVARLREKLAESNIYGIVVSELDEIAWILNIRGEGPTHLEILNESPLFQSLLVINQEKIILMVHLDKVTNELLNHLEGVEIERYETRYRELRSYFIVQADIRPDGRYIVTTPSTYLSGASYAIYNLVPDDIRELDLSPIILMKAVKNEVESAGMMNAHEKDAVALCSWSAFMENQIQVLGEEWTELSAAAVLREYRAKQQDNKGVSFGTISAFGSNGAIIHYAPTNITDAKIDRSNLYLVDSGGQYLDGTTDVTRTFHYGEPSEVQKQRYTDVLRGSIQLALVQAPEGTMDIAVDYATRQFLYKQGLEYRHGTGHGIGAYLEVHEGPTRIAMKREDPAGLEPGMFFSDEPGYYQDGEYGIRLETILRVVSVPLENPEYGDFIKFEAVTLVPFEPKLIIKEQLSSEELQWLRDYNQIIIDRILPRIENDDLTVDWIMQKTEI